MPVVLECQACGKSFSVPPVRAKTAKYCSNECAGPRRSLSSVKPKVAIECAACGKTFLEHQSHAARRKYCSRTCKHGHADYIQLRREQSTGENNAMWRGGTSQHVDGYVYEKAEGHPFSNKGYVFQHRLVAEQYLKEKYPASPCLVRLGNQLYLSPEYDVHHENEDRTDNRPENLRVLSKSDHRKLHNQLRRDRN